MQIGELQNAYFFATGASPAGIFIGLVRTGDVLSKRQSKRKNSAALSSRKQQGMRNSAIMIGCPQPAFYSGLSDDVCEFHGVKLNEGCLFRFAKISRSISTEKFYDVN